jgi:hypothetical protein
MMEAAGIVPEQDSRCDPCQPTAKRVKPACKASAVTSSRPSNRAFSFPPEHPKCRRTRSRTYPSPVLLGAFAGSAWLKSCIENGVGHRLVPSRDCADLVKLCPRPPMPALPASAHGRSTGSRSDRSRHGSEQAEPDFDREWRRRESNPRLRTAFEDSREDPDLARADAGKSASRPRHKRRDASGEKELPFIHPGQLSVFDLLGDG